MKILKEIRSLIPKLTAEEYNQLEHNIKSDGCRDPLVFAVLPNTEIGQEILIDGHNRYDICSKYHKEFKKENIEFENLNDIKIWVINNQFGRRNITSFSRTELALQLEECISKKAKENQGKRTDLEHSVNIGQKLETRKEIARTANVSTGNVSKVKEIKEKVKNEAVLEDLRTGKKTINEVHKEIRKEEIKKERAIIAETGKKVPDSDKWHIYQGDIRTWKTSMKYDYIITDPPYVKEFIPLYETLGERAKEWLKPNGLLITMIGQTYLDVGINLLNKNLTYYWCGAYMTPGQPTPLRQKQVNCNWKPLLIYSLNGNYKGKIFNDVFTSEGNDKQFHKWGQSESGLYSIISKICLPGQSILDPFCGGGSTGVAALKYGCLFDGIEILEENVNISRSRLNDSTKN